MSISKETTIWCDCDGCAVWERLNLPPRKAREELIKHYGWKRIKNKDICPCCKTNEAPKDNK